MSKDPIANFWSYGRELQEESKFNAALKQLLKEFRETLDDSSPLAESIDRNDSTDTMAAIAKDENFPGLAEILFINSMDEDRRETTRRKEVGRRREDRRKAEIEVGTDRRKDQRRQEMRRIAIIDRRANAS